MTQDGLKKRLVDSKTDPEVVIGLRNIHDRLYPIVCYNTFRQLLPALREAGVIIETFSDRPPRKHYWCYVSVFKTWMTLRGQKQYKKKMLEDVNKKP